MEQDLKARLRTSYGIGLMHEAADRIEKLETEHRALAKFRRYITKPDLDDIDRMLIAGVLAEDLGIDLRKSRAQPTGDLG